MDNLIVNLFIITMMLLITYLLHLREKKRNKGKKGSKSLFETTGGRRFIVTMSGYLMSLLAVSQAWITSQSYENVLVWLGGFFIAGNTLEQFKPNSGGIAGRFNDFFSGGSNQDYDQSGRGRGGRRRRRDPSEDTFDDRIDPTFQDDYVPSEEELLEQEGGGRGRTDRGYRR